MQGKSEPLRMRPGTAVVLLSIALGLFAWIVDAVLGCLFFYEGGFWELLILDLPRHELYIRTIILFLSGVYGEVVSRLVGGLREAEQRVGYLNLVLYAVLSVNQLITVEKDRDRLLKRACKAFHRDSLLSQSLDRPPGRIRRARGDLRSWTGRGLPPMCDQLERGELTTCGQKALSQPDVVTTEDPPSACADCPLAGAYAGRGAATVRLEHAGKVYGLLSVSAYRQWLHGWQHPGHLAVRRCSGDGGEAVQFA